MRLCRHRQARVSCVHHAGGVGAREHSAAWIRRQLADSAALRGCAASAPPRPADPLLCVPAGYGWPITIDKEGVYRRVNGTFVPPIVHQYDRAYEATKVGVLVRREQTSGRCVHLGHAMRAADAALKSSQTVRCSASSLRHTEQAPWSCRRLIWDARSAA